MKTIPSDRSFCFTNHPSTGTKSDPYDYLNIEQYCARPYHPQTFLRRQPTSITGHFYTPRAEIGGTSTMSLSTLKSPYRPASEFNADWPSRGGECRQMQPLNESFTQMIDSTHLQLLLQPQSPLLDTNKSVNTLEPQCMLQNHCPVPRQNIELNNLDFFYDSPYHEEHDSPLYPLRAYEDQNYSFDDERSPVTSEGNKTSPICRQFDDDADAMDKPYAKLIYEALLQAPGHKMMLRDIYDWFLINTTKPQESGTNGWQNSIRHNLSMNQAFENDKTSSSPGKGHSRKANSVWVLTDHAVRHGVQSTTRYRKQGSFKKGPISRNPAIQRQKSGARGGRATRRSAARMKKRGELSNTKDPLSPPDTTSHLQESRMDLDNGATGHDGRYEYLPETPVGNVRFEPQYALPYASHTSAVEQGPKADHYDFFDNDAHLFEFLFDPVSAPIFDGPTKIETE